MTLTLGGVTRIVGGETHIAEVNLELEPGSLNLLLGPTLSGKTSLMRLMAGLDRPTEGRVLADGRDVTGNSVRQRGVALRTVHGVQDRVAIRPPSLGARSVNDSCGMSLSRIGLRPTGVFLSDTVLDTVNCA